MRNKLFDWLVELGLFNYWRGKPGRMGRLVAQADVQWLRKMGP